MWKKFTYLLTGMLAFLFIACSEENPTDFSVYNSTANESSSSVQEAECSSSFIIEVSSSSLGISSSSDIAFSSSEVNSCNSVSSSSNKNSSSSSIDTINSSTISKALLWMLPNLADTVIAKYSGDTSEIIPAGRFYMIKNTPLSSQEQDLLKEKGIFDYGIVGKDNDKIFILLKSQYDIRKSVLSSFITDFFNTIGTNDGAPKTVNIEPFDIQPDSTIKMEIYCWPDIETTQCHEILKNCNGEKIEIEEECFTANIHIDSLSCLSQNNDIVFFLIDRGPPLSLKTANDFQRKEEI